MEVLFLGGLFPKEVEDQILSDSIGSVEYAANNLQWSLVKGFEDNLNRPLTLLNSMYIGSFPKRYSKWRIDTFTFYDHLKYSKGKNIGFINITGLKQKARFYSLKPHLKEWIDENKGKKKVVIAYAMTATFTKSLEYAKKIDPEVKTCLIVPDLPQYMNVSSEKMVMRNILNYFDLRTITRNMTYIDSYVVLTKHMVEELKINKDYVVVEGISNKNHALLPPNEKSEYKTIVYTGGLNLKYGIAELIDAFCKVSFADVRLVLCGAGDAEEYIRHAQLQDNRIIYKGLLKKQDIEMLQKKATLLINPRPNNEEYTKYSFPSKILEYMSSGTPVVAYALDGMPEEYDPFYFKIGTQENGLYNSLMELLSKNDSELKAMGYKAQEFVLNEKNGTEQCKKILSMLEKNLSDKLEQTKILD